ncbi:hypothetical protein HDU86_006702 [Geranomyces michiganensis]|nr:hypothetical protein HDU86_006702 [Geranomyces michiganensis]
MTRTRKASHAVPIVPTEERALLDNLIDSVAAMDLPGASETANEDDRDDKGSEDGDEGNKEEEHERQNNLRSTGPEAQYDMDFPSGGMAAPSKRSAPRYSCSSAVQRWACEVASIEFTPSQHGDDADDWSQVSGFSPEDFIAARADRIEQVHVIFSDDLNYVIMTEEDPAGMFLWEARYFGSITVFFCENAKPLILEDYAAVDVVNQGDLEDKTLLSLVDFKMMTTGKTWYEAVLPGLTPSGDPALRKVEANQRILQSRLSQTYVDWKWLTNKLINHPPFITRSFWSSEFEALLFETIKESYQTDATVLDVFAFDGFFFAHIMHHLQTAFALESLDGMTWKLDINAFALSSNAANIGFKDLHRNDTPVPFSHDQWGGIQMRATVNP